MNGRAGENPLKGATDCSEGFKGFCGYWIILGTRRLMKYSRLKHNFTPDLSGYRVSLWSNYGRVRVIARQSFYSRCLFFPALWKLDMSFLRAKYTALLSEAKQLLATALNIRHQRGAEIALTSHNFSWSVVKENCYENPTVRKMARVPRENACRK